MNKILIAALIFSTAFFSSCEREKPDPGATASVNMADEWWVKLYLNGVQVPIGTSTTFKHFYSYNTAANDNTMWFDDRGTLGATKKFKAMVTADYSALTFSAANVDNIAQATKKVTITNGKVLKGVGHSKTNEKTDSIYLNVEYSDDPGKIYTVTGHARTFFIDDDY
jgi:hypothetical protein